MKLTIENSSYVEYNKEDRGQDSSNESRRKIKLPERFNDFEMYMAFNAVSYVVEVPGNREDLKDRNDK